MYLLVSALRFSQHEQHFARIAYLAHILRTPPQGVEGVGGSTRLPISFIQNRIACNYIPDLTEHGQSSLPTNSIGVKPFRWLRNG